MQPTELIGSERDLIGDFFFFGLVKDSQGLWRAKGRLESRDAPLED
jgi:hypothetical protein